jgi:hypothetical protein
MRAGMKLCEDIEVKSNLFITVRERGKIVERREGHNIFLDFGREWLSKLIAFASFDPDVVEEDARIRYMGFGIGGTRQIAPDFADTAPLTDYGPVGSFSQTDTDPTVTQIERPVRLAAGAWVGQVQAPVTHDTATSTTFKRLFVSDEISYTPYVSVPLSEVGLFLSSANPAFYGNNIVAYDTFDTISKTTAFELEVVWTLRFG